jgi:hypothetical protein
MSLDVDLMVVQPVSVYSANITHNLGKMASHVDVGDGLTLYQILWRPDEIAIPLTTARQLIVYLAQGMNVLLDDAERLYEFNPENGWGNYNNLLNFTKQYLVACMENPDAELRISR